MKKLINGIINFRKNALTEYRNKFSKLTKGQSPDALLIACCDSRVVPNVFASTDPGDLFVLRNIGNLVPPYRTQSQYNNDNSVTAAIEFSIFTLKVSDIIVCGHSECGAMSALLDNQISPNHIKLKDWLQHAQPAYKKFQQGILANSNLSPNNRLSQINVIQQLEHLRTYPYVAERLRARKIKIHGWWFELATANVFYYDFTQKIFVLIDEHETEKILGRESNGKKISRNI